LFMLISWHWTYSKGLPKQQTIGILQYERIGAPDIKVLPNEIQFFKAKLKLQLFTEIKANQKN
jgi:hypothetical protein